eukprot:8336059-Pyramimonas_sp.AAC.2
MAGMRTVLRLAPALLQDVLAAMRDESVICCAAAQLLDVSLSQLRKELGDPALAPHLPGGNSEEQSLDERCAFPTNRL